MKMRVGLQLECWPGCTLSLAEPRALDKIILGWDMDKPTAKVLLRNESGYDETLWAFDLGEDIYKLANSPFFTYGVSYQDEIVARAKGKGEIPEFVRMYRKSGNRTIRIAGNKKIERGKINEKVLNDIRALGCSYEGASRRYISVNIPENVDLEKIVRYLIANNQVWEYADPTFEEINRGKPVNMGRGKKP